jgi:hypothetical protein
MEITSESALASSLALGVMLGLLLMAATPVLADADPSWYINCGVQVLGVYQLTNSAPAIQAMCKGTSGSVNVFAFQLNYAGGTFTVGSQTNAQIFFAATAAGTISGTWTLNDVSASHVISSGSFSGSAVDTKNSCSILNELTAPGTANSGQIVTHGDDMRMTISYTATGGGTFSICSGGASPSSTDTQVGVGALGVPEFGAAAALPAALALLLLRLRTRNSAR